MQLEGDQKGLEQLSQSFDKDPRIFEEDNEYYLWSSQFQNIDQSGEVQKAGEQIVRIVRHLGELDSLRVSDLEVPRVIEIQEDGSERKIVHLSASATATATASARVSIDGEELPPKAESTYEYTQLALNDTKVQELIELRDNGDHWVNLYRIYEYIEDNVDVQGNITSQEWWPESEIGRFKRTANSPEAIGHEARHADENIDREPPDPMAHAEAKSLIDDLIHSWLEHRKDVLESSDEEN